MTKATLTRGSAILGLFALLLSGPVVGEALAIRGEDTMTGAAFFSVWFPENDYTQVVIPPAFPDDADLEDDPGHGIDKAAPSNERIDLGSVTVTGAGRRHELSLNVNRITIPPNGDLRLETMPGAGLVVVESGWLELTERAGPARVTRGPSPPLLAPRLALDPVALDAGDRLSFEPNGTIVLENHGEQPASLLLASVTTAEDGM